MKDIDELIARNSQAYLNSGGSLYQANVEALREQQELIKEQYEDCVDAVAERDLFERQRDAALEALDKIANPYDWANSPEHNAFYDLMGLAATEAMKIRGMK